MSEIQGNDKNNRPETAPGVAAAADSGQRVASARRRRLIKLGAGAVPTALTLASRPVMAWHCNTASTWGSVQGVSTGASSYVRSQDSLRLFGDETYTVANWVANTTRGGLPGSPWTQAPLGCSAVTTASNYYKKYKISSLLTGTGASVPSGLSGTTTVWSVLNSGTSTEFQKLILTAWLNFKVLRSLDKCLLGTGPINTLVALTNGTYKGPSGATWTQTQTLSYLKKNYVSCKDEAGTNCGPTAV